MKFKQYLRQALDEQYTDGNVENPVVTNMYLQHLLQQAKKRIEDLSTTDGDDWLVDTRAEEIRKEIHDAIAAADKARNDVVDDDVPEIDLMPDMNTGLGNLPPMDLGFNLDLGGIEPPPPSGVKHGFGNQRSDPRYNF